jgi:hypothetical protein
MARESAAIRKHARHAHKQISIQVLTRATDIRIIPLLGWRVQPLSQK